MQGASIVHALKYTSHTDWDFSGAHWIFSSHPKWQGQSGSIGDLCGENIVTGSSSAAAGRAAHSRMYTSLATTHPSVPLEERGRRRRTFRVKRSLVRCVRLPRRWLHRRAVFLRARMHRTKGTASWCSGRWTPMTLKRASSSL
jgi:hypothetical protein